MLPPRPLDGSRSPSYSSGSEMGFSWDSEQEGWIRAGLPPLAQDLWALQPFRSAVFKLGRTKLPLTSANEKVSW